MKKLIIIVIVGTVLVYSALKITASLEETMVTYRGGHVNQLTD